MADVIVTLDIENAVQMLSDAVAEPLHEEKLIVIGISQKYVPIGKEPRSAASQQFGPLISTGYTSPPEQNRGDVTVKNGYDTPYALLQHETREFRHRPPASWKFLQRAEMEYAKQLVDRVAAKATARLGGSR